MFDRQTLFVIVIGISMVNGLFSPYLNIAVPAALWERLAGTDAEDATAHWISLAAAVLLTGPALGNL
jgi:hypothetical protein